jgi:hypothetical protein
VITSMLHIENGKVLVSGLDLLDNETLSHGLLGSPTRGTHENLNSPTALLKTYSLLFIRMTPAFRWTFHFRCLPLLRCTTSHKHRT